MVSLGNVPLLSDDDPVRRAGLACLLSRPAREAHTLEYDNAVITVDPNCAFAVCRFPGGSTHEEVFAGGVASMQAGLDLLSIKGQADLVAKDSQDEYVAWWSQGGKDWVAIGATVNIAADVGHPTLTQTDSQGNPVPIDPPKPPQHHPAYRFFRLSRVSDDLFDSYRNMYVAFELLLSDRFPKGREKEIDWLKDSLRSSCKDLRLDTFVPSSVSDPVEWFVRRIYDNARLPLFHAKSSRLFMSHGSAVSVRHELLQSLELLTKVVLRMAEIWHENHRLSGFVYLHWLNDNIRSQLRGSRFCVTDWQGPVTRKDDLSHERFRSVVEFPAAESETFASDSRFNTSGTVSVEKLATLQDVRTIDLVGDTHPLIGHALETPLSVTGFDVLEARVFVRSFNVSQPKTVFHVY